MLSLELIWFKVNPLAAAFDASQLPENRFTRREQGPTGVIRSVTSATLLLLPTLQLSRCLLARAPQRGGGLASPSFSTAPPDLNMCVHMCQEGNARCLRVAPNTRGTRGGTTA